MSAFNDNPKGCNKRGVKDNCPPKISMIDDFFDMEQNFAVIYTAFKIGEWSEKIISKNPQWKPDIYPDTPRKGAEYVADITAKLKKKRYDWPADYFPKEYEPWESKRGWYNPRQWQETAKAELREEIVRFKEAWPGYTVDTNPEARGVNVTGLMANVGITLDWRWPLPHDIKNVTYRVALAGHLKK